MTHRYALATTPDIPGHGAADSVHPPRVETYADVLEGDVPKDAVLIGHSLGGMVALEIASRIGKRVSGLIVIEAVPTVRDRLTGRITARVAQSIYSAIPPKWLARVSGVGQIDRTRAELRRQMAATDRARVAAALEASGQYDGRSLLAGIEVPTLVIVGTDNQATHRGAKVIAKGIPGAEFVALRGGHMLHTDNPDDVLAAINAFLRIRVTCEQ
ncbi:alpha/beta fold hydrolase [Phaeobacter inhibens]|uniref:alpha/beta fold hydrolase n=1 Tax=Phaeobacter inhibens TaxID=221822 RepID=UPI0021A5BB54|nr:alpha/beta hydrolase [Phaeobacter inhibens]